MMRSIKYILFFIFCTCINIYAQTPYDSFSPATSRPILDVVQKMVANKDSLQQTQIDAPLATQDDVSKWLSPDPLCDKYPEISPYAYCGWNPIMFIDPDGRDNYRYDHKTGDFVLQEKTNDNFDQIGKYKYNRKTGEYEPKYYRFKKDKDGKPIQKFYSAHGNTDGKIAKGILSDGLNIKQSGKTFVLNQTSPTIADYFKFALLLDKVAGVEISGYIYNNKAVHFDSYKNNSYNRSKTYVFTFPEGYQNIQHFHTHGHAGYSEAIQPSEDYDIPFKNRMISKNPGKDILFLILHNYGAPIRY